MRLSTVLLCALVTCLHCGPHHKVRVSPPAAKTEKCLLMEDVCGQAMEFRKQYDALPEEERTDYTAVLNTFIKHCENAKKACAASAR